MVDSKENYKFDLGVKGLHNNLDNFVILIFHSFLSFIVILQPPNLHLCHPNYTLVSKNIFSLETFMFLALPISRIERF